MDIDLLSKMVKELILDNDKVVLPGLGCFVAEVVPATFSDKGYTINPPYRKLYFRAKPDMDDVLVNFYASSNGLDREVACRIMGDFISELKNVIHARKLVVFPGLGRLRATKENNLFFIADENLDIYPAGFGLEPISLKTHQETEQEVTEAVAGLKHLLEEPVTMSEAVDEVSVSPELAEEIATPPEPVVEIATSPEPEPDVIPESSSSPQPELSAVADVIEAERVDDSQEPVLAVEEELIVELETKNPQKRPFWKRMLVFLGTVLIVAVILLLAYIIVAHTAPEFIDSLLYSPEELEILNHTL